MADHGLHAGGTRGTPSVETREPSEKIHHHTDPHHHDFFYLALRSLRSQALSQPIYLSANIPLKPTYQIPSKCMILVFTFALCAASGRACAARSAGGLSAGTCVSELGVGCGRCELEELAERIPEAAEVVLEDALVRDGGERVGPLGIPSWYTLLVYPLGIPSWYPLGTPLVYPCSTH